jgi:membrane protease YdiL (CAAX protease family)
VISVAAGALAFGGFGLLLWALGSGRVRSAWRFAPRTLPEWSWGELARILLLALFIVALLPFARFGIQTLGAFDDDPHLWMTGTMLVLDVFIILVILAFASGRGRAAWRTFGWSARMWPGAMAKGLRGYMAVFPWLFILLFLAAGIARRLDWTPPVEPIQELIFGETRAGMLALTTLLACVVGPVAEELFFRGLLFSTLRRRMSRWPATVLSGSAFALLHTNVLGFPSILLLGCLLANLYERTGSLASPLAVHILHNTLLLTVALTARQLMAAA